MSSVIVSSGMSDVKALRPICAPGDPPSQPVYAMGHPHMHRLVLAMGTTTPARRGAVT